VAGRTVASQVRQTALTHRLKILHRPQQRRRGRLANRKLEILVQLLRQLLKRSLAILQMRRRSVAVVAEDVRDLVVKAGVVTPHKLMPKSSSVVVAASAMVAPLVATSCVFRYAMV
jgi:hypothetical protein